MTRFETRFLRLVRVLAGRCPWQNPAKQTPENWERWSAAYRALFDLAEELEEERAWA